MKKLSLYIFLVLMWCNVGFAGAEIVRFTCGIDKKSLSYPFVGKLTFFRVYSGMVTTGDFIYNPNSGKKERVGRLMLMHSKEREERKNVKTGEIAAMVGLKYTKTGHTLCDQNKIIQFESMDFPEPVISVSVEAASKKDQENLTLALVKLAEEDPTFKIKTDEEIRRIYKNII